MSISHIPRSVVAIAAIALILVGGYFVFGREKSKELEIMTVARGMLVQEVSVTGRVRPIQSVNLAFEKSGRVAAVYADIDEKVNNGEALVVLENADLRAQLKQAQADMKAEAVKLTEMKQGTRQEDIEIQEAKVKNYEAALADARTNLVDKLKDAYTKADDAIRNKTDQFFNNPKSANPELSFTSANTSLAQNVEFNRVLIEKTLASWQGAVSELSDISDLSQASILAKNNLNQISLFLDDAGFILSGLSSNPSLTQATIDGWRSDVFTARTNTNTAISNITAAEEKWRGAKSNLLIGERELALKKAGNTPLEIQGQEARLESAEAQALNFEAQLAKTIIRAPFMGVVTKQEAKVGEIVAANTSIVSLISATQFEIEANIPEADIAKVTIGNGARITLDAYGRDTVFIASVVSLEPAETIIEGVATYKAIIHFKEEDARIKSGMTANVDIQAASLNDVITIPQRAVIRKNGGKFVQVLKNGVTTEVSVETGLRGSDGNIEITEGLIEGDVVVTLIEE
ncbi:MAG: efflux RND transporter periplasmic adaptor subunit [Parcubacteria group bacterium]|nr:efflux RND transporter periplasmic adaptor subunit [Parcubacteria group bacterium]